MNKTNLPDNPNSVAQVSSESSRAARAARPQLSKLQRFMIAYALIGFIIFSWVPTYYDPRINDYSSEAGYPSRFTISIDYPYGYSIALLGVFIFILFLYANYIFSRVKWFEEPVTEKALRKGLYYFSSIIIVVGFSAYINFGMHVGFIFTGVSLAFIVGGIIVLREKIINFQFLEDEEMDKGAKIAALNSIHTSWIEGLKILSTFFIYTITLTLLYYGFRLPTFIGIKAARVNTHAITIIIVYLAIGIFLGIVREIYLKLEEIEEKFIEIKR